MQDYSGMLFSIERNKEILDYVTFDGVPIWMIARYYLLYNVLGGKLMNFKSPERMRKLDSGVFSTIFKSFFYNMTHSSVLDRKKVVFYATNRKTLVDGVYFNRYVDDLYSVIEKDSCLIEQTMLNWEWPFPRFSQNIYFDIIGRLEGEVKSRCLWRRDYKAVCAFLLFFKSEIKAQLQIELSDGEWEHIAVYISKLIVSMRHISRWLVARLKKDVRCVIMVGAAFPQYYFLNKMLKERSIISVEVQHGYITKNNVMYNYAEEIVQDKRVKAGLPDFIFTYGSWWNAQFNCPIRKVSIGNPYRNRQLANRKVRKDNRYTITVMGIGENTDKYLELVRSLQETNRDFFVQFRPHPGELNVIDNSKTLDGVFIDKNLDVYDTLYQSDVIICEVSTVLFEAIGIVDRIVVWDTDYTATFLPDHPFESFRNLEEVSDLLNHNVLTNTYNSNDFWKTDWENTFKQFITETIQI